MSIGWGPERLPLIYLTKDHIDQLKRLVLEFCIALEVALAKKWPSAAADLAEHSLRTALAGMGPPNSGKIETNPPEEF